MTEEEALKELEVELATLEQVAVEQTTPPQEQEPASTLTPEVEAVAEPKLAKTQPKKSPKKEKKEPVVEKAPEPAEELQLKTEPILYGAARIKAKLNRH